MSNSFEFWKKLIYINDAHEILENITIELKLLKKINCNKVKENKFAFDE